jgi:hypothetical protein
MRAAIAPLVLIFTLAPALRAQDADPQDYLLRYKFTTGEEIVWSTLHQGAWTTKIKGHEQKSTSTSKSTKKWTITEINDGKISFEHSIGHVEMTRQVGARAPEHYDSRTQIKPPAGYEMVAETIGKTVTSAVIDDRGTVIERQDMFPKFNLSVGDLVTPLPEEAIAIGDEWYAADEVKLPVKGGIKLVKLRRVFTLEHVAAGLATVKFKTQVLTPVNDPHAEAQLIQHVTKGVIKFDVDAGRMLSRQLDWSDTVLGFEGPESSMVYLARFTEELVPLKERTAQGQGNRR